MALLTSPLQQVGGLGSLHLLVTRMMLSTFTFFAKVASPCDSNFLLPLLLKKLSILYLLADNVSFLRNACQQF